MDPDDGNWPWSLVETVLNFIVLEQVRVQLQTGPVNCGEPGVPRSFSIYKQRKVPVIFDRQCDACKAWPALLPLFANFKWAYTLQKFILIFQRFTNSFPCKEYWAGIYDQFENLGFVGKSDQSPTIVQLYCIDWYWQLQHA
jgi:hypothetical protein